MAKICLCRDLSLRDCNLNLEPSKSKNFRPCVNDNSPRNISNSQLCIVNNNKSPSVRHVEFSWKTGNKPPEKLAKRLSTRNVISAHVRSGAVSQQSVSRERFFHRIHSAFLYKKSWHISKYRLVNFLHTCFVLFKCSVGIFWIDLLD